MQTVASAGVTDISPGSSSETRERGQNPDSRRRDASRVAATTLTSPASIDRVSNVDQSPRHEARLWPTVWGEYL